MAIRVPAEVTISGDVVATNVSYEAFLRGFDGQHVEWIDGVVIRMSPVTTAHNALTVFLILLFKLFLARTTGGEVFIDPMILRLESSRRGRAPDLQVLLPAKRHFVQKHEIVGPPDLIVEVVSEGSQRRDRIEKFTEYERGGVPEYWIIDGLRRDALFNVLNEAGLYELRAPDERGIYRSAVLPGLSLDTSLLWRDPLPDAVEIVALVEAMLREP